MFKPLLLTLLVMTTLHAHALPRSVKLQHVALDLQLDWSQRQVLGVATLDLLATESTHLLHLDAAALRVSAITWRGKPLRFTHDGSAADGALRVKLPRTVPKGERLRLRIAYRTGHVNQSDPANIWASTGLGLRWFVPTLTDPRKRQQVWASGEARSARHWFPLIDEPGNAFTSEVIATVAKPLQVQAAGELVSVRPAGPHQRRYHWQSKQPHRSHQTLFIVGAYAELPSPHARLALRSLGYPHEMDGVAASVPRLTDTVDFFSDLLAQPFPVTSYRQVFVPDFPWGQSAPGLAMQSENMVDDAGTHADFLYLWNVLQAESAAAQWLGVRRSAGSWRDLWLDRALPRHLGGFYSASRNGHDEFLLYTLQPDMDAALAAPDALQLQLDATDAQLQSAHLSARGHVVLHMLRQQVGDAAWLQVLRQLAAGQGTLTQEDLTQALQVATGKDWGWFFHQWAVRGGHPVFEVDTAMRAQGQTLEVHVKQTQSGGLFAGHLDIAVDGVAHRVWLQAAAENRFELPVLRPPRVVQIDREGGWLKVLKQTKTTEALHQQLRSADDALGRLWAQQQLVVRAKDVPADRDGIAAALRQTVLRTDIPWRARWQALTALRQVQPGPPDAPAVAMLERLVHEERSWLRAQGLLWLGETKDAKFAPLYLRLLQDPSDRVVNGAAIGLGKSGHADAFAALQALPKRPSWKNQSLIAALNGLAQLQDPRGVPIALAALQDTRGERWTLATPVWDHRLAAADTLRHLGAGASGVALLQRHLADALAQGHVNDSVYNAQVLVALGVPEAGAALEEVAKALQAVPGMAAALEPHRARWQQLRAELAAAPRAPNGP